VAVASFFVATAIAHVDTKEEKGRERERKDKK
jgi:hypothetical protein